MILDIAVLCDGRVHDKKLEKIEKYRELRREIGRLLQLRRVQRVPVVIGVLGSMTKDFDKWMEKLGIPGDVGVVQKTALLGTAGILRNV